MNKKKKKNKNIIEIDKAVWEQMNYHNWKVVCNHSRIDGYSRRCMICGKSITEIEFERFLKNKKKEDIKNERSR